MSCPKTTSGPPTLEILPPLQASLLAAHRSPEIPFIHEVIYLHARASEGIACISVCWRLHADVPLRLQQLRLCSGVTFHLPITI